MAAGDITFYTLLKQMQMDTDAGATLSGGPVDWDDDIIAVAVLTPAFTPDTSETSTQKHLSDVLEHQVALDEVYEGPRILQNVTVSASAGLITVDADDLSINQSATGFTDGRWLVFFKLHGAASTSPLIAVGDLGSNRSIQAGALNLQWSETGLLSIG
jgi:hypothetical protein